jgi:hypothetical protein
MNPAVAFIALSFEDWALDERALAGFSHQSFLNQPPPQPACSGAGAYKRPELIRRQIEPVDPAVGVAVARH